MQDKIINEVDKDSRAFIKIFSNFLDAYQAYIDWMKYMEKKNGHYHDEDNFPAYAKKNIDLVEDIKKRGIIHSIIVKKVGGKIEVVDGFHRFLIARKYKLPLKIEKNESFNTN